MLKKCSKCLKILDENEFNWKYKFTKRSYHCKGCSRKYIQTHYKNNIGYYLDKALKRNNMIKQRSFEFLGPYLLNHPCVDCGESNILVLEFDHKERKMKDGEISRIIENGATLNKLIVEVQKCEVRCANCHKIKTAYENKNWKLKFISARSSTG